jgi:hypothetical protein
MEMGLDDEESEQKKSETDSNQEEDEQIVEQKALSGLVSDNEQAP